MGVRTLMLLVLAALALPAAGDARPEPDSALSAAAPSSLHARTRARLDDFTDWLASGRARGLVGEVGWPGNPDASGDLRWNDVARDWYAQAARADLWVAAWATGEIWADYYKLLAYGAEPQYSPVRRPHPQAAVIEAQPRGSLRGINVDQGAFGEFGAGFDPIAPTSPLHNANVGTYGLAYSYPGRATFEYLAARGISFVRLPFRWERLQREPGGALDPLELGRLRASIEAAGAAGLPVILDNHNYGAYYLFDGSTGRRRAIGSEQVTVAHFADFWRRLAHALDGDAAVLGYGLMNEPTEMAGAHAWEAASQAAVSAIRATGDRTRIFVSSYDWGGLWQFPRHHRSGPWIRDPARNTWYEAHAYFDRDLTARYLATYDRELELARAAGY